MDIRQIEVFLAVMEHSSVTRAAEKLFLSPGAVSLQLHNLAGELHTELADGRKFVLRPGMSYQVADDAEPHRSYTEVGATLFIVD